MSAMLRFTEQQVRDHIERIGRATVRQHHMDGNEPGKMPPKAAKPPAIKTTEHAEQCALIDYWAIAHKGFDLPEFSLYAIPNGGARMKAVSAKLKAEGARSGILDLNLDAAREGFHGLRIEMKVRPNKLTENQARVAEFYRQQGYAVSVCYSAVEAIDAIKDYLGA